MQVNLMDPRIRIWRSKRSDRERVMEGLDLDVADALERARLAPFPAKVRPATKDDLKVGAIIWEKECRHGSYWACIETVEDYRWRFWGTDGSLYELGDSFVEVEDE